MTSTAESAARSDSPGLRAIGGASVAELLGQRELLWNLTLRELRSKYKRSALGWFWSMLNPLSSIIIYSVVFGSLFELPNPTGDPSGLKSFTLWLTCALLPWNFLSTALGTATGSLVGNAGLMKKVYFPREYLVASTVLSWLVSFFIEMAVLMVAFLFTGHVVVQWIPVFLVVAFFQAILAFGFSLALSALNVYFRDVQHLIGIVLQIWFYLTPIVYPMDTYIHGSARAIYKLNPMVHFVTAYRNILFDGRFPGIQSMAYIVGSALVALVVGALIFRRLEPRMVEEL
jgi:ABC-type polysaccharide/polyol phosphate export permease